MTSETSELLAVWDTKTRQNQRKSYYCPSQHTHTRYLRTPRFLTFPCFFSVRLRPFTEHILRHVQGRKQLWFGWNQVKACVHVCVLWRWHYTFHDVDVAAVKGVRRGCELADRSIRLYFVFNWFSLSHKDPWGKIYRGKTLMFMVFIWSISHMHTFCICLFQWFTQVLSQLSHNIKIHLGAPIHQIQYSTCLVYHYFSCNSHFIKGTICNNWPIKFILQTN